jgi:hypothetical protein
MEPPNWGQRTTLGIPEIPAPRSLIRIGIRIRDSGSGIIARFKSGVAVRVLVDPRRNTTTPMNATVLDMFEDAGMPMRYKVGGGILHGKLMIFNGQNTIQWSAANNGDYYFKPAIPYRNDTDEGIYFTTDLVILPK